MAENSKIEWTTHGSCFGLRISPKRDVVSKFMTTDAKSDPVPHVEPVVWVSSKRQDVVGVEIAPSVIAAVGAAELVTRKYVVSPALQLGGRAQSSSLDALAVNVAWGVRTATSHFSRLRADLGPSFWRVLFSKSPTRAPFPRRAHLGLGLLSVLGALEGAYATFRDNPLRDAFAREALRGTPVMSGTVAAKLADFLPAFAFCASLEPGGNPVGKLFHRKTRIFAADFIAPSEV